MNWHAALLLVLFVALSPGMVIAQPHDSLPDYLAVGDGLLYDYADVLTEDEKTALANVLESVEAQTSAEIAVVLVSSLDGLAIDDFAARLFERWRIGQAGRDNGILLLTSIGDRDVRIEIGYGLEGALPDAKAGRLLDEKVLPSFRAGKYGEGLMMGVLALADVVATETGLVLTNTMAGVGVTNEFAGTDLAAEPAAAPQEVSGLTALWMLGGFLLPVVALMIFANKKGLIKPSEGASHRSTGSSVSRRSGSGSSRSRAGFGGGRSGGGGASRRW